MTTKQAREAKVLPPVHKTANHTPPRTLTTGNLTQASSIASHGTGRSTLRMQTVNDPTGWLNWFYSIYRPSYGTGAPGNTGYTGGNAGYTGNTGNAGYAGNVGNAGNAGKTNTANASQFAQQVLNLVNQERSKAGLKSLSMNSSLSKMALDKAKDMYNNNYFDHQSPTYGSPFDMMRAYGITYRSAGENIAKGQTSPTEVMNQWMGSPGHRANILNSSYTQIGIAYYNGEWVQEFIG